MDLVPDLDGMLQPHEGSSETGAQEYDFESKSGFNPTRVRLKHSRKNVKEVHSCWLQPHEGSSETIFFVDRILYGDGLQPHEGSSETGLVLRVEGPSGQLQPHEGSSETPFGSGMVLPSVGFNPTRVRLKHAGVHHSRLWSLASTPRGFV